MWQGGRGKTKPRGDRAPLLLSRLPLLGAQLKIPWGLLYTKWVLPPLGR